MDGGVVVARRLVAAGAAVAIGALGGCAVDSGAGTGGGGGDGARLTFASTGSSFQDWQAQAWQKPYTAESGVEFVNDALDEAKLKAMVESGNVTWDVVDLSAGPTYQYCGTYLEELDFDVIDAGQFPPETVNDCGVPAYYFTQMFLFNTERFGSKPPTSAADFFDTATYPGQRLIPPELSTGVLEFALIADGVAEDELYPLDVDRALQKLGTIKDELVFADSYGQVQEALVGEQVAMALSLTARTVLSIREGAPYDVVWDAVIVNWDTLSVPKGAPNAKEAMEFIAFVTRPEQQRVFAGLASNIPTNPEVEPDYDEVAQRLDPFAEDREQALVYANLEWWGENLDAATEAYTVWKIG
jgi:putative spermidine/putrescine transport system substrate-binding protein